MFAIHIIRQALFRAVITNMSELTAAHWVATSVELRHLTCDRQGLMGNGVS